MKRKFWKVIENWDKTIKPKMPLMVVGPRQVGKTYIINEYCKNNYSKYCYINLFDDDNIVNWFKKLHTFDQKLEMLESTYNINLKDTETILFIDEVQESEEFIENLKIFCEKGYTNIICAGSLLGVKLKRLKCSYPVGKVYEENMYPMDFEEYLWAIGKERFIKFIKKSFKENKECLFHEDLMQEVRRFISLGGMPKIIQDYVDNDQKISSINKRLIDNIINSYILDMKKYNSDNKESIRIERIFRNIPSQLSKENPKFIFAKLDTKDNRKRDYITALDWLTASRLVMPCYALFKPTYPILGFLNDETYKLYLNDTSIITSLVNINKPDIILDNDYSYKGIIVENYIATELIKQGYDLCYWTNKNNRVGNSEVDFVIQHKDKVIPIEVKAGTDMRSKSLSVYNEKFKPELMLKISAKNFGIKGNLKTIPLYAAFLIKDLLD